MYELVLRSLMTSKVWVLMLALTINGMPIFYNMCHSRKISKGTAKRMGLQALFLGLLIF